MSGEKTEQPTAKRLDEARRKGQGVGRSHELSSVLTLGGGLLALSALMPNAVTAIAGTMRGSIAAIGEGSGVGAPMMLASLGHAIEQSITLILPLAGVVVVAGIAGNLAAGGFVFATGAIRFDASRMNPLRGIKRMFDRTALQRTLISLAKLAVLAAVSWQVVGSRIPDLVTLDGADSGQIAGRAMSATAELGISITLLLGMVALIDWILQRRQAQSSLRMTKDEVKQEHKEQEGDPHIRSQRRMRARRLAFARMMDAVPTADVIVVNPIRLAIALRYDPATMTAPTIVAKGQRLMAARIRELAKTHGIPIVEDKPLARALFPRPVGSEVPAHLFRAVARILVLVAQLKTGRGPATARQAAAARAAAPSAASATPSTLPTWFGAAR